MRLRLGVFFVLIFSSGFIYAQVGDINSISGTWLICEYYSKITIKDTIEFQRFDKYVDFQEECNIGEKNSWIFDKKDNKLHFSSVDYRGASEKSKYVMNNTWEFDKKTGELTITFIENNAKAKYLISELSETKLVLIRKE